MTIEERDTARAIQTIARELKKPATPAPIDWEQRRYEIAKDIFTRRLSHPDGNVMGFCIQELDSTASECIREADALIKALKVKEVSA